MFPVFLRWVYNVAAVKLRAGTFSANIKILIVSTFLFYVMTPQASGDSKIKQPNVSGQFYEADANRLSADIDQFFAEASVTPSEKHIDVLIAPHAGYIYSGGVAAYGFKAASRQDYKTIVVLAPSHYVDLDGISIWNEGGFKTPLGVVQVDDVFAQKLIEQGEKFVFAPQAFNREHSLEVEIPFIQKTFKDFKIVPIVMGQPSYQVLEDFAEALFKTVGDRQDVLVVVSTDLSHFHEDAIARKMDRRTIEAVKNLKTDQLWKECQLRTMEMCGFVPVITALLYAKKKGLTDVDVLHYANSGDISGDMDRVVGYVSIVIYGKNGQQEGLTQETSKDKATLSAGQRKKLINIARATIEEYLKTGKELNVNETDERLLREEGAFVTLRKAGQLRGCIGNIIGRKPLYLTVRDMAISSATQDSRFSPVQLGELDDIDIEVSVLSRPKVIRDVDEIELGTHGVIVSQGPRHSGVFLPQVATETGWTKEEFLSQLCSQKAQLPADAWRDPKTKIEIFTAEVFSEKDSH